MLMHKSSVRIGILLSALAGFLPAAPALADSPRVTAVLSNSQVSVGQTVQMQVRVTGAKEASTPGEINVDGLEIHQTGTSRQVEMHNFDITSSVTYSYTILPLKAGAFTIPPQTIRVGSSSLQTPELRLAVVGSGGGSAGATPSNPSSSTTQVPPGKVAFAELIVTKKTAYVGEMVPVEIRLGFFSRARGRLVDGPELTGQGFTMQKLQQPDQPRSQTVNGKSYEVWTFKTAIAAARPGTFEIGPAQATALVAVPRRQPSGRSRSPFDIFNMDDPFSDPFFQDPFGSFGQQEKVPIKSEPASLEVKALPNGAPPNFSGAVGNFAMKADANPKSVQLGDPITVTATISGRGNFDRVSAPPLEDELGWHKYPPSAKFKQDDNVGISGDKTFEVVISPNENKHAIPPLIFSYFDPLKEQYVTLKSDPIPVRAEGGVAPAPTPALTALPARSSTPPAATPAPAPAQQDILYQLNEFPARAQSFAPLYMRPTFWAAQLLPLLALLGFIGWKVRRARMQDREARRTAALQHEAADLIRALRNDGTSPQEYYTRASRAIRVKTALAMKIDPNIVDAEAVAAAFHLDEASREELQRLFERSDEVKYSGGQNGSQTVPPEHRRATLALIESLRS
jgi:hypothetical protein